MENKINIKKSEKRIHQVLITLLITIVGISSTSIGIALANNVSKNKSQGNINISTLEDPRIKFTNIDYLDKDKYPYVYDSFLFDAEDGDYDGRVKASSNA